MYLPGMSLVWQTHCPHTQSPCPEQITELLSLRQLRSSSLLVLPLVSHSQFFPVYLELQLPPEERSKLGSVVMGHAQHPDLRKSGENLGQPHQKPMTPCWC